MPRDRRRYGSQRNLAKLQFPYTLSSKRKDKPCYIKEFATDSFKVATEGRKYQQNVQVLQFRFATGNFMGRVPNGYSRDHEKAYLAEAEGLLREIDDREDGELTYPPWIFYTKKHGEKKICKYVQTLNKGRVTVHVRDEIGTQVLMKLFFAVKCGEKQRDEMVKHPFIHQKFEDYIKAATRNVEGSEEEDETSVQPSPFRKTLAPVRQTKASTSAQGSPDEEDGEDEDQSDTSDQDSEDSDMLTLRKGSLVYEGYEDPFLNNLSRKNVSRKRTHGGQFKQTDATRRSLYMQLQENWPGNGVMCSCQCVFTTAAGVQSHMKRLNKNKKCRLYTVRDIYDV